MKRFLSGLILLSLLVVLIVPVLTVSAQTTGVVEECTVHPKVREIGTIAGVDCNVATAKADEKGICCLMSTIYRASDLIFALLMVISIFILVYGGVKIVLSQGDETEWQKGKTLVTYAIFGILIALFARVIPGIVVGIAGGI